MSKFIIVEQCDKYEECPGTWYFVDHRPNCTEWTDQKNRAKQFDTLEEAKKVQGELFSEVIVEEVKG